MARHVEGRGKKPATSAKTGMGYQDRKLQAKERRLSKKGKGPAEGAGEASGSNIPRKGTGKGFQIGPKPQKGVYTGKADRIKNTLIKNAKLKKQYAKVKAQEEKASRTASGEPDESMSAGSTQESDEAMSTDEDDKAEDLASPMEVDANRKRYRKPDPSRMQEDSPGSMRPKLKKRKSGEMLEVTVDSVEDGEETIAPAPGPDRPAAESSAPPFVHPSRRSDASKGKSREIQPQEPKRKRQRLSEKEVDARREKREADKRAWAKKGKTGQPHMGSRMNVLLGKIQQGVGRK